VIAAEERCILTAEENTGSMKTDPNGDLMGEALVAKCLLDKPSDATDFIPTLLLTYARR
jgi:hypothetical protein